MKPFIPIFELFRDLMFPYGRRCTAQPFGAALGWTIARLFFHLQGTGGRHDSANR
jgi:hypothetical protein